jgi:hypothetical protein
MLYPQKNLLNPDVWQSGRIFDTAFKPTSFRVEPNRLIITSASNSMVCQIVNVDLNTDYTVYHNSPADGRRGIYIYSMSGTDLKSAVHTSPVTFNSGANNQVIVGFYKSSSANDVPEIDINYPMMEKGADTTGYAGYNLGMKKTARFQKINDDMSAAGSHAYPYGNVISVKEDVRLWNAQIKVFTAGTFNVIVQEWDNGRIGDPLFDSKMDATVGTFNYSFGGVKLFAGKKYWIGRLSTDPTSTDNVGNAAVGRSTGMPATTFKYVDTLGGTSFRSTTVDYPSTYYYFYGLEFQAIGMKQGTTYLRTNLSTGVYSVMHISGTDSSAILQTGVANTVSMYTPVTPNKTYRVTKKGSSNRFSVGSFKSMSVNTVVTNLVVNAALTESGSSLELNVGDANYLVVYLSNINEKPEIQIEEAPYDKVMKPASLVPEKNLLSGDVFGNYEATRLTFSQYGDYIKVVSTGNGTTDNYVTLKGTKQMGAFSAFPVKPNTNYVFTSVMRSDGTVPFKLRLIEVTETGGVLTDVMNLGYTGTDDLLKGLNLTTKSNTAGLLVRLQFHTTSAGEAYFKNLMLKEGSDLDAEYKPYTPTMKPAILYPKKNLLPSDTFVTGTWQGVPAALNKGTYETNTFRAAPNPVRLKPGIYALSSKFPLGAGVQHFSNGVVIMLSSSAQLPQTFNINYEVDVYFHFRKNDGTVWNLSDNPVDLGIQLETGSTVTPFEPYNLMNKPL